MNSEEMLCEKIIACFQRDKGRDIYDAWFMVGAGVNINKKMLIIKKEKEKATLEVQKLITKEEYGRDMMRLTKRMVAYEQVKKEVLDALLQEGIVAHAKDKKRDTSHRNA